MAKKQEPDFLRAIKFIAKVQKDIGAPYQTHFRMANTQIIGTDGTITAGHLWENNMLICPHTISFLEAAKRCKGAFSLTEMTNGSLQVKSGRFKAVVPCLQSTSIPTIDPDLPLGETDNRLRDAILALNHIVSDKSPRVVMASLLLNGGSLCATDSRLLVEYWHGNNMPTNIILPKNFIKFIDAHKTKNFAKFGFSPTSFTVHFDDGSWVKTQLYQDKWPNLSRILNVETQQQSLPDGFFDAVQDIAPFTDGDTLYITPQAVSVSPDPGTGASYEMETGATVKLGLNHMKLIKDLATSFDFTGVAGVSYFYGDNVRGALSQVTNE